MCAHYGSGNAWLRTPVATAAEVVIALGRLQSLIVPETLLVNDPFEFEMMNR